jgi:CDP-paratose 2-epimerase
MTDFSINASATLILLEATRTHAPKAAFVFTSTNKVYGDTPNRLPFVELETRWDLPHEHPAYDGIDESMSIDDSTHSLFGVSKVAADLLVQEYGRYFGLRTAAFRCGCITGPAHAAAKLHGFLAYLVLCFKERRAYQVIGYRGKQVRDNIASVDLVRAFDAYLRSDLPGGAVFNMGGGRANSCSIVEAIDICTRISGRTLTHDYVEQPRIGDHQWYISDLTRARAELPGWDITESLEQTITTLFDPVAGRT